MKNILVPVDFSDVTEAVVEAAFEQAVSSDAVIRVVHAAAVTPAFVGYGVGVVPDVEFREKILEAEQKQLDDIVNGLRERGVFAESDLPEGPIVDSL